MTPTDFHKEFRQLFYAKGLDVSEAARRLQVSRPTIDRWLSGQSCPHEVGREPIINWLRKYVK